MPVLATGSQRGGRAGLASTENAGQPQQRREAQPDDSSAGPPSERQVGRGERLLRPHFVEVGGGTSALGPAAGIELLLHAFDALSLDRGARDVVFGAKVTGP